MGLRGGQLLMVYLNSVTIAVSLIDLPPMAARLFPGANSVGLGSGYKYFGVVFDCLWPSWLDASFFRASDIVALASPRRPPGLGGLVWLSGPPPDPLRTPLDPLVTSAEGLHLGCYSERPVARVAILPLRPDRFYRGIARSRSAVVLVFRAIPKGKNRSKPALFDSSGALVRFTVRVAECEVPFAGRNRLQKFVAMEAAFPIVVLVTPAIFWKVYYMWETHSSIRLHNRIEKLKTQQGTGAEDKCARDRPSTPGSKPMKKKKPTFRVSGSLGFSGCRTVLGLEV
eukprot:1069909-Prorocentrum_minimum.AAC.3